MSNIPSWEEDKQDSSNLSVWIIVGIFTCLVLCAAAAFCGLGLWTIRNNSVGDLEPESDIATQPAPDFLEAINTDEGWKLVISDEFKDNQNKWEVGPYQNDAINLERSIEEGKYTWDFESKEGWLYWSFPDITIVKDFVATVEMNHIEGNSQEGFGLIVRAFNNEYYLFQIREIGVVSFHIFTNDKYSTLMEHSTSVIKVGEPNQITVQATGNHFTFYINNQQVGEIEDDRLSSGYLGILASTMGEPESTLNLNPNDNDQAYPSKYEIDNFKVWAPVSGYTKLEALTPEKGRIVFASDADGNPEIYSVNSDGTDIVRLTNSNKDDTSPKWSPDGSKIAFVSTRDGNAEIYTMNSDGSGITRITDDASDDIDPSWSPDGQNIVFSSNRNDNYEIYVHNLKTGTDEQITENFFNDRYPDWSSKNDLILYRSSEYGSVALYTVQVSTKESTRVSIRIPPASDSRPVFSEDALEIIYESGISKNKTGIIVLDLESNESTELVGKNESNLFPSWSSTGQQVVFVSDREGQTDIYIISNDGKSIFRVTDTAANEWDLDWTNK